MEDPRITEARVKVALAQLECEAAAWAAGAAWCAVLGELAPRVVAVLDAQEARSARYEARAAEEHAEQKAERAEDRAERKAEKAKLDEHLR